MEPHIHTATRPPRDDEQRNDHRSITQLFADVTKDSTDILQHEIRLARLEITEKVAGLRPVVALLGTAAAFGFGALLILLMAASLALARVVQPLALATVLVGVGAALVALVTLAIGLALSRNRSLTPDRSQRSLQADKELLQRHF